jgi:hypothetical protein
VPLDGGDQWQVWQLLTSVPRHANMNDQNTGGEKSQRPANS